MCGMARDSGLLHQKQMKALAWYAHFVVHACAWLRAFPWLVFCLGLLIPLKSGVADEPQSKPPALQLGIAPHTSARALFLSYRPLRLFLQEKLQREVRIVSAPNFEEFLHRALEGRYDIVITTGHQARLLQVDQGWLPLVTYQADFRVVLVKAVDNLKIQNLSDLNGRRFLSLGPGSLTAYWSQHYLQQHSIVPSRVDYVSASDSLAELIVSGVAEAGALSQVGIDQLAASVREKLFVFERSPAFLGRTYMLNPRLSAEYPRIRSALDEFASSAEGQGCFQRSQLIGYREILPSELEAMDPYAHELRKLMAERTKRDVGTQDGIIPVEGAVHVAK